MNLIYISRLSFAVLQWTMLKYCSLFDMTSSCACSQGLMELPLLKRGEIEIPKRWHMGKNTDRHLLDVFRDLKDPPGIKLLMGLLKYNPAVRLTAEEALGSEYFSKLVRQHNRIVFEIVYIS